MARLGIAWQGKTRFILEREIMKMLLKMFICFVIGAGFGWFTSTEWSKWHKEDVCEWKAIVPIKKTVTREDIKVLDWRVKRCR